MDNEKPNLTLKIVLSSGVSKDFGGNYVISSIAVRPACYDFSDGSQEENLNDNRYISILLKSEDIYGNNTKLTNAKIQLSVNDFYRIDNEVRVAEFKFWRELHFNSGPIIEEFISNKTKILISRIDILIKDWTGPSHFKFCYRRLTYDVSYEEIVERIRQIKYLHCGLRYEKISALIDIVNAAEKSSDISEFLNEVEEKLYDFGLGARFHIEHTQTSW